MITPVIPISYSSTTMKLVKLEDGRKTFPPLQFSEMIDIAKSSDWEFDDNNISLSVLVINGDNSEFDRIIENKLIKYEEKTNDFVKSLYKLRIGHSSDHDIFLFGDYKVLVNGDNGTLEEKNVSDLEVGDAILSKIFDNVISSLSILNIESLGDYEIAKHVELDIEDTDYIAIGDDVLEIFIR